MSQVDSSERLSGEPGPPAGPAAGPPGRPPTEPPVGRLKRAIRPVMVVIALVFLGLTALELRAQWQSQGEAADFDVHPGFLGLSVMLACVAPVFQGLGWIHLMQHLEGRRLPWRPALRLYFDSQIARYVPGKVGLPAVRLAGAGTIGASRRAVGASILIELASWVVMGALVGVAVLSFASQRFDLLGSTPSRSGAVESFLNTLGDHVSWVAGVSLGVTGVFVLVLRFWPRERLPSRVRDALDVPGTGPLLPGSLLFFQAAYWLTWTAQGMCLAWAIGAPSMVAAAVGGLLVLGVLLGFLSLFAPAGAGVREAVIALGAAPLMGAPAALAVGILARAGSLVGDVLVWLVVRARTS